jgi:hypothetical protein
LRWIHTIAEQRKAIEKGVPRTQRAEETAERPIDKGASHKDRYQKDDFPHKLPAQSRYQSLIGKNQGDTSLQGPYGTNPGAEKGKRYPIRQGEAEWYQQYRYAKNEVFCEAEFSSQGAFSQVGDWYLREQFLYQPKGAKPPAYGSSKYRSKSENRANKIKGEFVIGRAECCLQRADGTGADCGRTGITVQSRDTDGFGGALRDVPRGEARQVKVVEQCRKNLDQSSLKTPYHTNHPIPMHSKQMRTALR